MVFWFTSKRQGQRRRRRQQPERKVVATPSCDLWDLVLDMDWDRVVEHAKEFPLDAEWIDGDSSESPLYLACQSNAPLSAIQAIIKAYPAAVLTHSRANKDLPIHIACRYQADEAILAELVKLYPVTVVEQTLSGHTPIMVLWEFRSQSGTTASANHASDSQDGQTGDGSDEDQEELIWRKILVLLMAVARFREDPVYLNQMPATRSKEFQNTCPRTVTTTHTTTTVTSTTTTSGGCIVHAAASLGSLSCPVEVLEYALSRAPQQAFQRDCWGQLPLHIAVGPTLWSSSTRRKYKLREREFIRRLLSACPGAARERVEVDGGRFPLHIALANRRTWSGGVDCLFRAAPEVLMVSDPATGLYPFQLAAVGGGSPVVELDTIYELFRSQPDVLERMELDPWEPPESSRPHDRPWARRRPRSSVTTRTCSRGLQDAVFGTLTRLLHRHHGNRRRGQKSHVR